MEKIVIFDFDSIERKKDSFKKRLIALIVFDVLYVIGIALFIIFLNRENTILFSILIAILSIWCFSSTYFYSKTVLVLIRREIKFLQKLNPFDIKRCVKPEDLKVNKSLMNKYNYSFYPITYLSKKGEKEIYLKKEFLDDLIDFDIDTIFFKNKYIVEIHGEYKRKDNGE